VNAITVRAGWGPLKILNWLFYKVCGRKMEWLFFDVGSTLVNEEAFNSYLFGYIYETIERSRQKITHENFDAALKKIIEERRFGDRAYLGLVEGLAERFSSDKKILLKLVARYKRYASKRYLEKMEPYPDALATVAELSKRYKLGIIANQPVGTRQRITSFGLAGYFGVIILSDAVKMKKPDARIFQLALKMAECSPEDATMIGDRLDIDMGPSKRLGFRTIRVKHGIMVNLYPLDSFEIPDYEVNNLKELLEIL
jgi:putative hydrolase of the HAD superfamily